MVHFIILSLLLVFGMLAQDGVANRSNGFMSIDELRRGMTGIGRTVFQGTKIDSFKVEILGVLRNYLGPQSDLILAKFSGGPLENTGMIAGMSGSPVYIDGKLIGAVGYTWTFSKEPIGGITPIAEMMEVLDRSSRNPDLRLGSWWEEEEWTQISSARDPRIGKLKPMLTPLVLSGFSPRVVPKIRLELLPFGLLPILGGGGSDSSLPTGVFEPGAALGVQLLRGDFSMTAIGTLTYREGDRVIGFGHPMLFGGSIKMPMTSAYIHEVIPSQFSSFKLGTATRPLGAILQDRAPGIAGILGSQIQMIPVQIEVYSKGAEKRFQMEVLQHKDLGPLLTRMAVFSSLIAAEKLIGETTVKVRAQIRLKGVPPFGIENIYAGPNGIGLAVMGLTEPLGKLMQNPFQPVEVEKVSMRLEVEERARVASIEVIRLQQATIQPGDTVQVTAILQPYLGDPQEVDAFLVIPLQIQKGSLILRVSSAGSHRAWESKRVPDELTPRNFDHLIRVLSRAERNDHLIFELISSNPGVTVEGREITGLPSSVLSALQFTRESGAVRRVEKTVVTRQRFPTNYVLSGGQSVAISLGGKRKSLIFRRRGKPFEEKK